MVEVDLKILGVENWREIAQDGAKVVVKCSNGGKNS